VSGAEILTDATVITTDEIVFVIDDRLRLVHSGQIQQRRIVGLVRGRLRMPKQSAPPEVFP
jgi:hypothetical protein